MDTTDARLEPLHERIAALGDRLAPVERHVAQYLLDHPQVAAEASAVEIGRVTGTSDASVVRTVKALGYDGLRELRRERVQALAAQGNPEPMLERRLGKIDASAGQELLHVIDDTMRVLRELRAMHDRIGWEELVQAAQNAARVIVFGVGTPGAVAEYVALQLTRSGIPSLAITRTGFQLADDLFGIRADDLVIVIAPLRRYDEIDAVLDRAREVGAVSAIISETLSMAYRDAATLTLATPRTTVGTASEVLSSLLIGHALVLALASHKPETALSATRAIDGYRQRLAARGNQA